MRHSTSEAREALSEVWHQRAMAKIQAMKASLDETLSRILPWDSEAGGWEPKEEPLQNTETNWKRRLFSQKKLHGVK